MDQLRDAALLRAGVLGDNCDGLLVGDELPDAVGSDHDQRILGGDVEGLDHWRGNDAHLRAGCVPDAGDEQLRPSFGPASAQLRPSFGTAPCGCTLATLGDSPGVWRATHKPAMPLGAGCGREYEAPHTDLSACPPTRLHTWSPNERAIASPGPVGLRMGGSFSCERHGARGMSPTEKPGRPRLRSGVSGQASPDARHGKPGGPMRCCGRRRAGGAADAVSN